ncbi:TetR/AcrR family transcriptional regulator [Actinoplanes friuliensis]|uniref:HTH-type transcriptional regulator betI n=1 Tax=Actinoplanes friuliensis DSM 7358 TaxID=1246995 RepID=U5WAV9_9ACTN|nr:TetR/AcrR family transcriptional regulator [Actinoplanes friuliensis]AGZ46132.1 HTH-type transcriptional regulator betI [Actinoplanes friuliensis DSM 7358]
MAKETYHHGDLRRALLAAAAEAITESGPAALSLRDLARRVGVSHAAPTHHFGDKKGLLTALATEGFERLSAALTETRAATGSFLELGVAYVRFATTHPAHFQVMWRPDLFHEDDEALQAAQERAGDALYGGVADLPDGWAGNGASSVEEAGLAAWSLAHGFATLWLSGAIPRTTETPDEAARAVLRQLTR